MSAVIKEALLNFRPMVEEDLPGILAIEESAYEFPWTRMIFQDCLRVGYCSWVLERERAMIGYGVMSVGVGECHILNLCVQPQCQRSGYGHTILDYLLDLAIKHDAEVAFLEVRPSNAAARQLYTSAGFNEVGLRRNYYPARFGREDALIMARSLI
jgi:ribosomal-protein-alanine N-acetyltransferase